MASLKEIKERIGSVTGTLKVTNAMRMVASVKFRRACRTIEAVMPYHRHLQAILEHLTTESDAMCAYFPRSKPEQRIAVVAIASDSGLCGSYNSNIIRMLEEIAADSDNVEVYPIGKKVRDASMRMKLNVAESASMFNKLTNETATALAAHLEKRYLDEEIDRVVMLYHHLRSAASTEIISEDLLPVHPETDSENRFGIDFIIEPDSDSVIRTLLPKLLSTKMYAVMCDAAASEHASRMVAMQTAGDNADKILGELRLQYNQLRQQAITSQLLDIVGGTMR